MLNNHVGKPLKRGLACCGCKPCPSSVFEGGASSSNGAIDIRYVSRRHFRQNLTVSRIDSREGLAVGGALEFAVDEHLRAEDDRWISRFGCGVQLCPPLAALALGLDAKPIGAFLK